MAKKEKTVLLSLKKSTTKKTPQASCGHAIFGHAAFLVIVSGIAALCGVNHALSHHNVLLQSVVSSIFCISAGLLYGIFMIISRLLSLILSYAEKRSIVTSHYYSDLSYDGNKNKDGDNERRLLDSSDDDDEEEEEQQYIFIHGKRRQVVHHYNSKKMLSRSVVISSMYLGGSGAYLAIPPLCMWDPTVSASFIFCIVILSMVDGGKIISEFKSNIDTGQTITNLRITRLMIHVAIMVTICLVILLDSNEDITRYYSIIATAATHHGNHSGGSSSSSEIIHSENHDGGIGIFIRWPLIILAASSPILLRAGGGGVGPFTHSLPPSQTMETGLPVSILLSILVICWYSPLESPLLKQLTNVGTLVPMFILCPLLISGALVFVLRGFKNRSCSYTSIILTCILVVRQQITRKLKDKLDWVALSLCIFSVTLTIFFILYKKNVTETAAVVVSKKPFYHDDDDDDDDMEKATTKNSKSHNNNNNNAVIVASPNSVSYEQEFNDDLNNDDDDDDGNDKRKGERKT
jgi:hypothetical protein